MTRRHSLLAALILAAAVGSPAVFAQAAATPVGELKSLGGERYQIGQIVVDKRAGSFTVPGRVHVLGKPLEYLATSPKGMKAYESLLELDATGTEFNLACILVGLDRDPRLPSAMQFRKAKSLVGQRVALSVAWTDGGKRHQMSAAEALLNPEAGVKPETVDWIYTGSPASVGSERFTTDITGTLIGFIHDVNTLIEASASIGVGAYGSVRGHPSLPPVGTAIELVVETVKPAQ